MAQSGLDAHGWHLRSLIPKGRLPRRIPGWHSQGPFWTVQSLAYFVRVSPFRAFLFLGGRKALQDKAMQRQTSTNQSSRAGARHRQVTCHFSSCFLGGAPGERHRATCKTDSTWCDTIGGVVVKRQTQTLRGTGQETHRATLGSPGQTGNATMTTNQAPRKEPRRKQNRVAHTTIGHRSRSADVLTHEGKKGLPWIHPSCTPRNKDGQWAAKQGLQATKPLYTPWHTGHPRGRHTRTRHMHEHTRIDTSLGTGRQR